MTPDRLSNGAATMSIGLPAGAITSPRSSELGNEGGMNTSCGVLVCHAVLLWRKESGLQNSAPGGGHLHIETISILRIFMHFRAIGNFCEIGRLHLYK
jgi:hypothetical protein